MAADSSAKKRKINLLIAVAGLNIGGAEVVIQYLVNTIDRARFNITICCIKTCGVIGEQLAQEGFETVTLSNPDQPKVDYFTFVKLLHIVRDKKIDVIHTHTNDALADAAVCKLFVPWVKLIHTFHFGNYTGLTWRQMWIEQVFSRLASRLIAVGEVQRQQIRKVFHFRANKVGRVWNGISSKPKQADFSFRSKVGAENMILIGTIATLIEQKGLFNLIEVARHFKDIGEQVKFVIVGEGKLRSQLEAKRHELGLEDTVLFTGWVMGAAEVALPTFDIFFQPSLWEAMSIAILEAMAAERAIVATKVGENPYIIEDKVNGLLVSPKDISGMVNALRQLIVDKDMRNRLGKAAAKKVSQEFTAEIMTRQYEDIYEQEFNKGWFRGLFRRF